MSALRQCSLLGYFQYNGKIWPKLEPLAKILQTSHEKTMTAQEIAGKNTNPPAMVLSFGFHIRCFLPSQRKKSREAGPLNAASSRESMILYKLFIFAYIILFLTCILLFRRQTPPRDPPGKQPVHESAERAGNDIGHGIGVASLHADRRH